MDVAPHSRLPSRARLTLGVLALAAALLSLALFHGVLGGIPHGWDALSYHYQARVFASGHLTAPALEVPDPLFVPLIVEAQGRRFAKYPPGWPLVLAPFVGLGVEGLAGALLLAAMSLLVFDAGRRLFASDRVGWIAAVLVVLSPFAGFMSAGMISHLPCAVGLLGLQACLLRALGGASHAGRWCVGAGLAAALAFLCRPYSAVLGMAGVVLVVAVATRARPRAWMQACARALPTGLLGVVGFLAWNAVTTGSPWKTGYHVYSSDFGFLGARGEHRAGLLANAVVNVPHYLRALRSEFWGGLLPDAVLPLAGLLLAGRRGVAFALAGAAAVLFAGYAVYFYFDLYYGPRLIFEAFAWIVLLAAAGIEALSARLLAAATPRLVRLGGLALLAAWGLSVVALAWPRALVYHGASYSGQDPRVARELRESGFYDALVFVMSNQPMLLFGTVMPLNAVVPENSSVLFLRYSPGSALDAARAWPRANLYLVTADYEPLPGRNIYHDRFAVTNLRIHELRGVEDLMPSAE
jgi:hypothetical protein